MQPQDLNTSECCIMVPGVVRTEVCVACDAGTQSSKLARMLSMFVLLHVC